MGTGVCASLTSPQACLCFVRKLSKVSTSQSSSRVAAFHFSRKLPRHIQPLCIRSDSSGKADEKTPFGYTRKDVLLVGLGLIVGGVGLKFGLEFVGVDSLRAGNVVQLVMVFGLTVGWISTYVFRVSTKEMTYAKQLEDYESKVIQKRLEELPEAELETLLAQVEEEKQRIKQKREKLSNPE